MATKFGLDCKLYYSSTGIDSPSWTELTAARDVTLNLESDEGDFTNRGSGGWKVTEPGLKDASIDFDLVYDTADAGFSAIKSAYFAGTLLGIAVMDGNIGITDVQGLWADCKVFSFSINENLGDGVTVSVSIKPAYSTNTTQWITVGST